MSASDIIALVSIVISVIAFLYTYFTNTKKYELLSAYRLEVLSWYGTTIDVLSQLIQLSRSKKLTDETRASLLSTLSSQIEKGRFYFPNVDKNDNFGANKPLAFQGYRNIALDFLVFTYNIFKKDDSEKYVKHAIELQKHFTSYIFETIDPNHFIHQTGKITGRTFKTELSFEDYIKLEPDSIKAYF